MFFLLFDKYKLGCTAMSHAWSRMHVLFTRFFIYMAIYGASDLLDFIVTFMT